MIFRPANYSHEKRHQWKADVLATDGCPFNLLIDDQIEIAQGLPPDTEAGVLIVNGGDDFLGSFDVLTIKNPRWRVFSDWKNLLVGVHGLVSGTGSM